MMRNFLLIMTLCWASIITAKPLTIVVSIKPLYFLTAGITRDIANIELLVPENYSSHDYALKPSDRSKLELADIIIWLGPEMESFLSKPLSNLNSANTFITLLHIDNIEKLYFDAEQKSMDPHIWLDPKNAVIITNYIAKIISEKDPSHSADYYRNAQATQAQLQKLHQQLTLMTKTIRHQPFFVYHDGLNYFTHRYELTPPSAHHILQLHDRIKHYDHPCVFTEPEVPISKVKSLVEKTDARVGELDIIGIGLPENFSSYETMLKKLVSDMKTCMQPSIKTQ
jgi:zinc transport system substrate-binding protein